MKSSWLHTCATIHLPTTDFLLNCVCALHISLADLFKSNLEIFSTAINGGGIKNGWLVQVLLPWKSICTRTFLHIGLSQLLCYRGPFSSNQRMYKDISQFIEMECFTQTHFQNIIEGMVPHMPHVFPVLNDAIVYGICYFQLLSLFWACSANHYILLKQSHPQSPTKPTHVVASIRCFIKEFTPYNQLSQNQILWQSRSIQRIVWEDIHAFWKGNVVESWIEAA